MPTDGKYGKITTEFGDIPDDEPVFLFRGRDMLLPAILGYYATFAEELGSPAGHVDIVNDAARRLIDWQTAHPDRVRMPTSTGTAGATYWDRNRER